MWWSCLCKGWNTPKRSRSQQMAFTQSPSLSKDPQILNIYLIWTLMMKTVMNLSMQIMGCRYCAEEEGSRRIGNWGIPPFLSDLFIHTSLSSPSSSSSSSPLSSSIWNRFSPFLTASDLHDHYGCLLVSTSLQRDTDCFGRLCMNKGAQEPQNSKTIICLQQTWFDMSSNFVRVCQINLPLLHPFVSTIWHTLMTNCSAIRTLSISFLFVPPSSKSSCHHLIK